MEYRFEIQITGIEHHTWQGVLSAPGGPFFFRSEMELLLEMMRRLDAAEPEPARSGRTLSPECPPDKNREEV